MVDILSIILIIPNNIHYTNMYNEYYTCNNITRLFPL